MRAHRPAGWFGAQARHPGRGRLRRRRSSGLAARHVSRHHGRPTRVRAARAGGRTAGVGEARDRRAPHRRPRRVGAARRGDGARDPCLHPADGRHRDPYSAWHCAVAARRLQPGHSRLHHRCAGRLVRHRRVPPQAGVRHRHRDRSAVGTVSRSGAVHGLRACWSFPILATDGRVLGTAAVYYRQPRTADPAVVELVSRVAHVAAIAIERRKIDELALALSEEPRRFARTSAPASPGSSTTTWASRSQR